MTRGLISLIGGLAAALSVGFLLTGCQTSSAAPAANNRPGARSVNQSPAASPTDDSLAALLKRLTGEPNERDVVAARDAAVDMALDDDGGSVAFYRIVAEKQRLDARSLFGLTRDERFFSDNLRRVLLAIGSARSLQALRPEPADMAPIDPLLSWAAARLDPDDRRQTARRALVEADLNRVMRARIGALCQQLLREMALWIAPDPARPDRVRILPLAATDNFQLLATTREAFDHALADELREIPGVDAAGGNAADRMPPRWLLQLHPGISGLFMQLLDARTHDLAWAGAADWRSDTAASGPGFSVSQQLAEVARVASDIAIELGADAGGSCCVLPFTATDEATDLTLAARQRVLAALSVQRRIRTTDAADATGAAPVAAFGTRPEESSGRWPSDTRFLIAGTVEGAWARGQFVGRLTLRALDLQNDLQPAWQATLWQSGPRGRGVIE